MSAELHSELQRLQAAQPKLNTQEQYQKAILAVNAYIEKITVVIIEHDEKMSTTESNSVISWFLGPDEKLIALKNERAQLLQLQNEAQMLSPPLLQAEAKWQEDKQKEQQDEALRRLRQLRGCLIQEKQSSIKCNFEILDDEASFNSIEATAGMIYVAPIKDRISGEYAGRYICKILGQDGQPAVPFYIEAGIDVYDIVNARVLKQQFQQEFESLRTQPKPNTVEEYVAAIDKINAYNKKLAAELEKAKSWRISNSGRLASLGRQNVTELREYLRKLQADVQKLLNTLTEALVMLLVTEFEERLEQAQNQESIDGWEHAFRITMSRGEYAAVKEQILNHEEIVRLIRKAQDMAERLLIDTQNGLEGEKYTEEEEATYPLHALILNADDPLLIKAHVDSLDETQKAAIAQERNSRGQTPLTVAIVGGNPEKVKLLFKLFPDSLEMSQDRALEKWRNMNPSIVLNPEESSVEGQRLKAIKAPEIACAEFKETLGELEDRADKTLSIEECKKIIDEIQQYCDAIDRCYKEIDSREDGSSITNFRYKNQLSAFRTEAQRLGERFNKEYKVLKEQEEATAHLASCTRNFDSLETEFNDPPANQDELSRSLSAYIKAREDEIALAQNGTAMFGSIETKLSELKQKAETLKILLAERSKLISQFQAKLDLIVNPNGGDILSQLTDSVRQIIVGDEVSSKEKQKYKQIDKQLEEFLKEIDEKKSEVKSSDRVLAAELDKIKLDAQRMQKKLDEERTFAGYLFKPLPEGKPELRQNVIYVSEKDGCALCQGLDPEGRPYEEKKPINPQITLDEQLKAPDFQRAALKILANQGMVSYSPQRDWQFVLENLCQDLNAAKVSRRAGNLAFLHEALKEMGIFCEGEEYYLKLSEAKNHLEYNDYLCNELSLIKAAFDPKEAQERQETIKKLYVQQFKLNIATDAEPFLDLPAELQKAIRMVTEFRAEDLKEVFDVEAAQKQAEKGLDEEGLANLHSTKEQIDAYAKESAALVELQRKLETSTAEIRSPEVRRKSTALEQLEAEKKLIIGRKEQFSNDKETLLEKESAFKKEDSKLSAEKTKRETLEADITQNGASQKQKLEEQKGIVKQALSDLSKKFPKTFFSFVTRFFIPEVRLAVEIAAIQEQVNRNAGFDPKNILGQIKSAIIRFEQESGDSLIFGAESEKIISAQNAKESFSENESTFIKENSTLKDKEEELKRALPGAQKKENLLVNAQSNLQNAISKLKLLVSDEKEEELVEAEADCDKKIKELKTALETASAENKKLQNEVEAKQKSVGEVKVELMKRKRPLTERLYGTKSSGDVSALQRTLATLDENYKSPSQGAVLTQDASDVKHRLGRSSSMSALLTDNQTQSFMGVPSSRSLDSRQSCILAGPGMFSPSPQPSSPESERFASDEDTTDTEGGLTPSEVSPAFERKAEILQRRSLGQPAENSSLFSPESLPRASQNSQTFLPDKTKQRQAEMERNASFLSFGKIFDFG